jgi:filamentous hemagglutinin family protein
MVVNQTAPQAVIDWKSFNIGSNAWTQFNQQGNTNWVALNRIYDQDPTQIFGKLTADGKIYLINRNGILFGPGSQVNVNSLVASSLNIKVDDFIQGINQFQADAGSTPGAVSNHGAISAGNSGSVFLIGPTVENNGTIDAPYGQIGLVAGTQVNIAPDPNSGTTGRWALVANVQANPGQAWNMANGRLSADQGLVGMYGATVQQDGIIRAVTAIQRNGQIELLARDRIVSGAGSVTATPVSAAADTVNSSSTFTAGSILLSGLDQISSNRTPVSRVELNGSISAPGGNVKVEATDRVYLAASGSIDVSGIWNDMAAGDSAVTSQYTSVVLRDAYQQKNGIIKGTNVTASPLTGVSFGDISDSLGSRDMTALERCTTGGTITISALNGDIITRSGSLLDISGGGTRYSTGTIAVTKLVSGNRVYDISNAPQNINYSQVLGYYALTSKKFGKVAEFTGIYYGSGSPLNDLASNFIEGSNAGTLTLVARSLTLDGRMNGSVTKGFYQTLVADPTDQVGRQTASGLQEPIGGSLIIGQSPDISSDLVTRQVVVASDTTPLSDGAISATGPTDPNKTTVLSARALNAAGLSNLQIYANTSITTNRDASIELQPGGSLAATSRRIEHQGQISVPGGLVTLITQDNKTSYDQSDSDYAFDANYASKIYLAGGSKVNVAGQQVDNLLAGKRGGNPIASGHLNGGVVRIEDETYNHLEGPNFANRGVIINQGAVLDVSGGYQVNANGSVSGGNAGTIYLQGATLIANGDFRGFSLPGRTGGTITLSADNVEVKSTVADLNQNFDPSKPLPQSLLDKLILTGDRFADTGFTSIALQSVNNVDVDSNVTLMPSLKKLPVPSTVAGRLTSMNDTALTATPSGDSVGSDGMVSLADVGVSAIQMVAGHDLDGTPVPTNSNTAMVSINSGAAIRVAPAGNITLTGPGITVTGLLDAPSGNVALTSTLNSVTLNTGARINAAGYNKPDTTVVGKGVTAGYAPMGGGTVTLAAKNGDVILNPGAVVDVSGSQSVTVHQGTGGSVPVDVVQASDPGTVNISYLNQFRYDGASIVGKANMNDLRGGTLSVEKTDKNNGLTVSAGFINNVLSWGFDALTFKSGREIAFSGPMEVGIGRKLTLDAPEIRNLGTDQIGIASPWIRLVNSGDRQPVTTPLTGKGSLNLVGEWIDVEGDVALSGFDSVQMTALRDIRLYDRQYSYPNAFWSGRLATAGDLTLKADRIYPGMTSSTFTDTYGNVQTVSTPTDFTISSGGKVTTLPGNDPTSRSVYSAGGKLTINAAGGIEHNGTIVAPLGEIVLNDPDPTKNPYASAAGSTRVYLAPGSVLSTAGSAVVDYGFVDANGVLRTTDKSPSPNAAGIEVDAAPQKSITVNGKEVIARDGATIEVSGGGGIMAYNFQPGIEGTFNPLTIKGRTVIVPGNLYDLPGEAIYLNGGAGLAAGVYSILPAAYAFLPGAMVITDLGTTPQAKNAVASDGSPIVSGYSTVMGTGVKTNVVHYYSVRMAEDVRAEGNFTIPNGAGYTAGNAGSVAINGSTTILNGAINAAALPGYDGGSVAFGGKNIYVQSTTALLPTTFGFNTSIDPSLNGTLQIASSSLSGKGLQEISLGTLDTSNPANATSTVTIAKGSALAAPIINLAAKDGITLEDNVSVTAAAQQKTAADGTVTHTGGIVNMNTQGTLTVGTNAVVSVDDTLNLQASQIDLRGSLKGSSSRLNVSSDRLILGVDTVQTGGLALTNGFFSQITGFDSIGLKSGSDLLVRGNVNLDVSGTLSIDAARIVADAGQPVTAAFTAGQLELLNSGATAGSGKGTSGGTLSFNADGAVVGNGDIGLSGFATTSIAVANDLTFRGKGSLTTGGDLDLTAARITVAPYVTPGATDTATPGYQVANFLVDAGNGALNLRQGTGTAGQSTTFGGSLAMRARTIDVATTVDVPAGQLTMTASGSAAGEGVVLESGARLAATGHDYGSGDTEPGGNVTLRAANGVVHIDSGATVDVSAAGAGDAGDIVLDAPVQGVTVNGTILGASSGGKGGSISIDTQQMTDFAGLNTKMAAGGFTEGVAVRARSGDLTVDSATTLKARNVALTADSGNLTLQGKVDASGTSGGSVALNAGKDLTVGGTIDAHATDANGAGGSVALNSEGGNLSLASGSLIDVSGGSSGTGGSVDLRAQRTANDVAMALSGTIRGASRVSAEAFTIHATNSIGATEQSAWQTETTTYMANADTIKGRLLAGLGMDGWNSAAFHFLPGIEVQSSGDLTVSSVWDFSPQRDASDQIIPNTGWRYNGEAGNLTLRAAGNLNVNQKIVDSPTYLRNLPVTGGSDSWGINLFAGSDLGSADIMAVRNGTGNLTVSGANALVYTESGPLRFAAGNDVVFGNGVTNSYMINASMKYTFGTYNGSISGKTGGDLVIQGGAIQSARGDIDIAVGGDLNLASTGSLGSIRTTGVQNPASGTAYNQNYWEYQGGGDIRLDVAGTVNGSIDGNNWDYIATKKGVTSFSAQYGVSSGADTRGLATMGGGSLDVRSGGDFTCQAGTFGSTPGNLDIHAGGDLQGRFLVHEGNGILHAGGNFGSANQVLEAFDARFSVVAQGSASLGTVYNPTILTTNAGALVWVPGYTPDTSLRVTTVTGDIAMTGVDPFSTLVPGQDWRQRVLPGTVELSAGRDIRISNSFALAPSANGNLQLKAGRDISGGYLDSIGNTTRSVISMSDADPARFYGRGTAMSSGDFFDSQTHSNPGNQRDNTAITISAGVDPVSAGRGGDLTDLQLFLPKQAEVSASRDIRDIYYVGQNLGASDVSFIKASRNITFSSATGGSSMTTGIDQGGAGSLLVHAGGDIDLGTSMGIKSTGNAFNPALGSKGSMLVVVAGTTQDVTLGQVDLLFNGIHTTDANGNDVIVREGLRDYGTEYATNKSSDPEKAAANLTTARTAINNFFFGSTTDASTGKLNDGVGSINMTSSQISTNSGKDDIYVLARSVVNVGKTTMILDKELAAQMQKNTGIYTARGGNINIISGGDLNVNESRVMTFFGGDITAWSDQGNINAGRGSKSTISTDPPKLVMVKPAVTDSNGNILVPAQYELVFSPPAVGSGIRALTYSAGIGETAPPAGSIYAFAPNGNIDAGEAGMAGNKLVLGATKVLNSQNISFSAGSVGVPTSEGTVSIGSLGGTGAMSAASSAMEQSAAVSQAASKPAPVSNLVEDFIAKWLDVKVLSFDEDVSQ